MKRHSKTLPVQKEMSISLLPQYHTIFLKDTFNYNFNYCLMYCKSLIFHSALCVFVCVCVDVCVCVVVCVCVCKRRHTDKHTPEGRSTGPVFVFCFLWIQSF